MIARVYFVGPKWARLDKWTFPWLCARLAVTLTRSDLLHVSVGNDDQVGSCAVRHVSVFHRDKYEVGMPGLLGHIDVPITKPIHPIRVVYMRPVMSIWPSLLKFITFGLTPAHNCVSVAADLLREGGVPVPRRFVSPKELKKYLEQRGFQWVSKQP